jgi:curved DNA-binding protein CbpA
MSNWPDDPFELLGVRHDTSLRDVRRAYVRLIRHYKPEHAPDEFQRISDAYDFVKSIVEREAFQPQFEPLDAHEDGPRADECDTPIAGPREDPHQRASAAWQKAIEGDVAAAVRTFAELVKRYPQFPEIQLQSYWLLTVWGEPEAALNALTGSLKQSGSAGHLQLYTERFPFELQEVSSSRCRALYRSLDDPYTLAEFLKQRWAAAAGAGAMDLIETELAELREEMLDRDPLAWGRVVEAAALAVASHSTWHVHSLSTQCFEMLGELDAFHEQLEDVFEQVDLLELLARGGTTSRLEPLVNLACASLVRPFEQLRTPLFRHAAGWIDNLDAALETFDRLVAVNPVAAALLRRLGHYFSPSDPPVSENEALLADSQLARFLALYGSETPASLRKNVLMFCLREWVSSEALIDGVIRCQHRGWLTDLGITSEFIEDRSLHNLLPCLRAYLA